MRVWLERRSSFLDPKRVEKGPSKLETRLYRFTILECVNDPESRG
jgi:hypothetical protein